MLLSLLLLIPLVLLRLVGNAGRIKSRERTLARSTTPAGQHCQKVGTSKSLNKVSQGRLVELQVWLQAQVSKGSRLQVGLRLSVSGGFSPLQSRRKCGRAG